MAHDPSNLHRAKFADRLRTARKARGFRTARSFAERIGVDQNTYTRYERGEVEPNVSLIERMWQALDLPPTDLFGASVASGVGDRRSAMGFADEHGQLRDATERALAWQVAETYVAARAPRSANLEPLEALRAAARVYADLAADPFGAVARLVIDTDLEQGDAGKRQALIRRVATFTATLAQPHAGVGAKFVKP